ncbi:hypothetical protein ELG76_04140 [Rhizobium leguminosarum]|uniref:spike base protein, RCAP_Rcc01079 family n=1 Tax=Rhizobium leguminosarum TaxID=384 RepID=UPI0010301224|nr:hypothetical protein [Rhizobium leguminosarum]TBG78610.1 hypothetical protein ELG76_04140 [Rhizobium leguminosarum]
MAASRKPVTDSANATAPASGFAAITPHDSTDLTYVTRGVYVGGAGNIVAVDERNNPVTFTGVTAGTVLPIRVRRINSTSTTATSLVALW